MINFVIQIFSQFFVTYIPPSYHHHHNHNCNNMYPTPYLTSGSHPCGGGDGNSGDLRSSGMLRGAKVSVESRRSPEIPHYAYGLRSVISPLQKPDVLNSLIRNFVSYVRDILFVLYSPDNFSPSVYQRPFVHLEFLDVFCPAHFSNSSGAA